MLVYDITSKRSFEEVVWLRNLVLQTRGDSTAPLVLIGNKYDLEVRFRSCPDSFAYPHANSPLPNGVSRPQHNDPSGTRPPISLPMLRCIISQDMCSSPRTHIRTCI